VLPTVRSAREIGGWLIIEESLGVTGAGNLAIITSDEDYPVAAGKKSALIAKLASADRAAQLLVAENIKTTHPNVIHIEDVVKCMETRCAVTLGGREFSLTNPLIAIRPYRSALMLAAAAAILLGIDPAPLNTFTALPGRMSVGYAGDVIVVDNSNSGTNTETTLCAARYARTLAGTNDLTLVIGQAAGDGAVCEGFSAEQVQYAIEHIRPGQVIYVGMVRPRTQNPASENTTDFCCKTLDEGRALAVEKTRTGSIVLAVKTWR
jgi:UDP-N-acetylmuramyl pentapeptide synthase